MAAVVAKVTGAQIYDLVFLILALILIPGAGFYAHRRVKREAARVREAFARDGYVVEHAYCKPIGPVTKIWGDLGVPVSLYVRVSSLDPVQVLAGRAGIADVELGDPEFDRMFVVRTNDLERVKVLLTPSVRHRLLQLGDAEFRTASIDSLFSTDYFPERREGRDLRRIWMLMVGGELTDQEAAPLVEFGRSLGSAVVALSPPGASEAELRVGFFEGR